MATHSSILAWIILWTEELGRLQLVGSRRVGHDWVINSFILFTLPMRNASPGMFSKTETHIHLSCCCKPSFPSCTPVLLLGLLLLPPPHPAPSTSLHLPSEPFWSCHWDTENTGSSPCPQRVRDPSGPQAQEISQRKDSKIPAPHRMPVQKLRLQLEQTSSFSGPG